MSSAAARPDAAVSAAQLRLRAYLACLTVAFGLHLMVHGLWQSPAVLILNAAVLAVLAAGLALGTRGAGPALARGGALAATVLVLAVPLASRIAAGETIPAAIHATIVWPQILATLFASRVLSELAEFRLIAFCRDPRAIGGRVQAQSLAGAVSLGCCLTLIFYQIAGGVAIAPERLDPAAIALRAATGQTALHAAIVFLFFVVVAAILDATLMTLSDSLVLGAVRRFFRDAVPEGVSPPPAQLSALLAERLGQFSHSRAYEYVREALRGGDGSRHTVAGFHAAARRMLRALISFLPLLGFLGTVIGLTAAVGGLPAELVPEGGAQLDISASLLGLALKFETTLLGLAGALAASLMLSVLEKHESEIEAQCRYLAAAVSGDA